MIQHYSDSRPLKPFDRWRSGFWALRHAGRDAVYKLAERRVEPALRVWQIDLDLGG